MSQMRPLAPQFYMTAPQPCPYLEDRLERKMFTSLQGDDAADISDRLSKHGFRRSQHVMYRPACTDCCACMSVRIPVAAFAPSKSQKRIMRKNSNVVRRAVSPWASEEQYELFSTYIQTRHGHGGMSDMDVFEFASMVEETPIRTRLVEYHSLDAEGAEHLIAGCLTDIQDDGLSMVYSFFEPSQTQRSLGSFMILDHIALARQLSLPYVYLGYWVQGSPAMNYKQNFKPLEVHNGTSWTLLKTDDDYTSRLHTPLGESIAEQVAFLQHGDQEKAATPSAKKLR